MNESGPLFGQILIQLGLVSSGQVDEALSVQRSTGQRVGEALISLGYVTRHQLEDALAEALGFNRLTPAPVARLGDLLVGLKHITPEQLEEASRIKAGSQRKLGQILVELGCCSYREVYEGLALQRRLTQRSDPEAIAVPQGPVRVAVVDDSEISGAVVQMGLSELGYEVTCYSDPGVALKEIRRTRPSVVVTDLQMPGMDGLELSRRLKATPTGGPPVIILTGNDGDAERVAGLRAGADDYVNKQVSMNELGARIDSLVRRAGETERVRRLFARYTSDAVVEEALKRGDVVLTGEKREVTVLFADIRDFTSLAERLPPEHVVAVLNQVLGRLSDAVLTCGGTLDKYLGDGLMAVFGAPVRRPDDALRAVQSAQMMMRAVVELNGLERELFPEGSPENWNGIQLGVGINTGMVVAGNLGSQLRTEYTCIGDAVNVASRLCQAAPPTEIWLGTRTHELVGDATQFEPMPPVRLKGKAQAVPAFRVRPG
ncbi:MAG TPA: adenylate/guanylate cyclase domain-containing protein [Myxococcaceae bacterium]|nr:adenylate/guanylate cyclase domain-containing protein [Myxococcaceae bacterium]